MRKSSNQNIHIIWFNTVQFLVEANRNKPKSLIKLKWTEPNRSDPRLKKWLRFYLVAWLVMFSLGKWTVNEVPNLPFWGQVCRVAVESLSLKQQKQERESESEKFKGEAFTKHPQYMMQKDREREKIIIIRKWFCLIKQIKWMIEVMVVFFLAFSFCGQCSSFQLDQISVRLLIIHRIIKRKPTSQYPKINSNHIVKQIKLEVNLLLFVWTTEEGNDSERCKTTTRSNCLWKLIL